MTIASDREAACQRPRSCGSPILFGGDGVEEGGGEADAAAGVPRRGRRPRRRPAGGGGRSTGPSPSRRERAPRPGARPASAQTTADMQPRLPPDQCLRA